MGSRESANRRAMGWPCAVVQRMFVPVRVSSVWYGLSGFFFCLQGEFLFVFDLFLFYLFVEVAPVAARDDELVGFQFRMNAFCPIKEISVERILCGKPDARQTVSALPLYALQALLKFSFRSRHDVSAFDGMRLKSN